MGKSRVDRLAQQHGLEIEWKGFELHPEVPAEGAARPPGHGSGLGEHLQRLADEEGLKMSRPELRSNSHLALLADAFARDAGQQEPFHSNMLAAYWRDQRNIGQRGVVLDVARESGLDTSELEKAFDDGRYEQELIDAYDEANRFGINGVPAFIIGRYLIMGAQPYEVLEEALKRAENEGSSAASGGP